MLHIWRCKDLPFKFVKIPVQNWGEWMSCWTRKVFLICRKSTNPCHGHDNWWFLRLNRHLIYVTLPNYNWNQFQIHRSSTNTHHHPMFPWWHPPFNQNLDQIPTTSTTAPTSTLKTWCFSLVPAASSAEQRLYSAPAAQPWTFTSSPWIRLEQVGFRTGNHQNSHEIPWNPPLKQSFYWAARWVADSTMEITKNAEHVVQMDVPSGKHTKNYGTSPLLMGWLTISMAIFNSYVKLPDSNNRCVSLPQKGPMLQDVLNYWIHCKVL